MTWEGAQIAIPDVLASGTSLFSTVISESTMEGFPNPTIVRVRGNIMVTQLASWTGLDSKHSA